MHQRRYTDGQIHRFRWTVWAESIASVLKNYEVLQSTWQEASSITSDSEMKARIGGVSASMETFDFIFWSLCNIINIQPFLVEVWNIYYIYKYISDLHLLQLIVSRSLRSLANYQYSTLPHRRTIHIAHKVGIIPKAKANLSIHFRGCKMYQYSKEGLNIYFIT